MGILRIQVSPDLVEQFLTTGYEVSHHVITKGLPKDSKLIDVCLYTTGGGRIDLDFETEVVPDGDIKISVVEVTEVSDVVGGN